MKLKSLENLGRYKFNVPILGSISVDKWFCLINNKGREMRIIKHKTLKDYYTEHPEIKGALESWFYEVKREIWRNPEDVRANFSKARTIPGNRIVFNILRNRFRLVVKVEYQSGLVFIRFIGTHKEYDQINAEEV